MADATNINEIVKSVPAESEKQIFSEVVTQAVKQIDDRTFEFTLASENINFNDMSKMDVQTRFASNAPVLINHDHNKIVGQWKNTRYEDGKWKSQAQLSVDDEDADWAHNLIKQGHLKAVSIGALPERDPVTKERIPVLMEASLVAVGLDKTALAEAQLQSLATSSEERTMSTENQQAETADEEKQDEDAQASDTREAPNEPAEEPETESTTQSVVTGSIPAEYQTLIQQQIKVGVKQEVAKASADIQQTLERVHQTIQNAKSLLPRGFDSSGMSERDVLLQVVSQFEDDAKDKDTSYLQGFTNAMILRRTPRRSVTQTAADASGQDSFDAIMGG